MGRVEVNGAVVETSDGVEYGDGDRATSVAKQGRRAENARPP